MKFLAPLAAILFLAVLQKSVPAAEVCDQSFLPLSRCKPGFRGMDYLNRESYRNRKTRFNLTFIQYVTGKCSQVGVRCTRQKIYLTVTCHDSRKKRSRLLGRSDQELQLRVLDWQQRYLRSKTSKRGSFHEFVACFVEPSDEMLYTRNGTPLVLMSSLEDPVPFNRTFTLNRKPASRGIAMRGTIWMATLVVVSIGILHNQIGLANY